MLLNDRDPHDTETLELLAEIQRLTSQGAPVTVDPDLADEMGAFLEDALSDEDAIESLFDPEEIEPDEEELDGEEEDHG